MGRTRRFDSEGHDKITVYYTVAITIRRIAYVLSFERPLMASQGATGKLLLAKVDMRRLQGLHDGADA